MPKKKTAALVAGENLENKPPLETQIAPPPDIKPIATETHQMVLIKNLHVLPESQARLQMSEDTVLRYATAIVDAKEAGMPNPFHDSPIGVVRDHNGKLYPFDYAHRTEAHKQAKEKEICADLYEPPEGWSGKDYAILLSLGANEAHGLPRTNKDKARAAKLLVNHPEWSKWGDPVLAAIANCSVATIRNYRPKTAPAVRLVTRKGKTQTMNTANLGSKEGRAAAREKKEAAKAEKAAAKAQKQAAKASKGKKGSTPAGDTSAGENGQTSAPPKAPSKAEQEIHGLIIKIADAQPDSRAKEVREALENNTLGLSHGDIRKWGETDKDRIRQLTPLIVDKRWTPARAGNFIDKEFTGKTTLDELALILLTRPEKRSETVAGLDIQVNPNAIEFRLSAAAISA